MVVHSSTQVPAVSRWPASLDLVQGISGLLLVLFMWVHMFLVSSILLGKEAMYAVTRMLEGEFLFGRAYPALVAAVAIIILLIFLTHALVAMWKMPGSYREYSQFWRLSRSLRHSDSRLWLLQVVTGLVLMFTATIHLYEMIMHPANIGPHASAARVVSGGMWLLDLVMMNAFLLMKAMQEILTDKVAIFRSGERLEEAVSSLQDLLQRSANISLGRQAPGVNPELVAAYRMKKMLKLALCVSTAALARTESRGAHYREDCPQRDDSRWLSRTLQNWPENESPLPQRRYEALDVEQMELLPGWRGYGERNHIEHPQVAGLEQQDGRQGLQQQSLQKLPPQLQGVNARLEGPNSE